MSNISSIEIAFAMFFATWLLVFFKRRRRADNADEPIAAASLQKNPPEGHDYEVFLNFRGTDVRKTISDMLYVYLTNAGIRTFRDDNELRVGEEIGQNLMKAIRQSKIAIPIFSKNYASSKWCLRELTEIVRSRKTSDQKIMPVFYNVTPDDVKLKTSLYKKALAQHRKRYGDEVVQEWEDALKEVATVKGLTASGYLGQFTEDLVMKVMRELKRVYLAIPDTIVGTDENVKKLMRLLNDSVDVKVVGIHGMGGVGKTTLAKLVYNKLCDQFEYCSFLPDVRETSEQQQNGLKSLQDKLISDIQKVKHSGIWCIDEGVKMIRERCSGKNVLILLDDVDERSQLEALAGEHNWFGPGSKIIVTTRNIKIFSYMDKKVSLFKLKELDDDQSLELFSKHAFKRNDPPHNYHNISKEIASTAAGLPLALEVIGSSLRGKGEAIWEETSRKLKNIPDGEVQQKLKISYEALKREHREIFLDIACLFIGEDKSMPMYLWDDSGLYPKDGLDELVVRSLVRIKNNRLWMHDQLRDLGREIVRQENIEEPGKRSRLWSHTDAVDTLKRKSVCIAAREQKMLKLSASSFALDQKKNVIRGWRFDGLTALKFLEVQNGNLVGNFNNLRVKWLCWRGCPSNLEARNIHLKGLVILDLSYSEVADNWEGWKHIEMMKRLKVLNLTGCVRLRLLPNLSAIISLERLILEGCQNLCRIGLSDLKYGNLVILNMKGCNNLKFQPKELESMKALSELRIDGASKLQEIPISAEMKKLEILSAAGCCSLTNIPASIYNLKSLVELNLRDLRLTELPDSIGNLKRLKVLNISNSCITKLPGTVGMLTLLEVLDASKCDNLEGDVDADFGGLLFLKELYLDHTNIYSLPKGIDQLPSLKSLSLLGCMKLNYLPKLPSSLETLEITLLPMEEFACLQDLVNLKKLWIYRCKNVSGNPGYIDKLINLESLILYSTNICALPIDISSLSTLEELIIVKCERLQFLLTLPSNLSRLHIRVCELLSELPDLSKMKMLSELSIAGCSNITKIQGLENLDSLVRLDLADCNMLRNFNSFHQFTSLKYLSIFRCKNLEVLPDLSDMIRLTKLEIRQCKALNKIKCIGNMESLEDLCVTDCEALEKFPDLSKLKMLSTLVISHCISLSEIIGLGALESLKHFEVLGCENIIRVPDMSSLNKLERLKICNCRRLVLIKGLEKLESLRELSLDGCTSLKKIPKELNLRLLKKFSFTGLEGRQDIKKLASLLRSKSITLNIPGVEEKPHLMSSMENSCDKQLNKHLVGRYVLASDLQGTTKVNFFRQDVPFIFTPVVGHEMA